MTNQIEYDEEVAHFARQRLFDYARKGDGRPFCLTVSFTHPHDPYVIGRRYWDLYADVDIPMPAAAISSEEQDPHSRRILESCDFRRFNVGEDHVRAARRAYFGAISYLDDKIGELLETLAVCGFSENTVILFTSDHGDMLGERGLWFKMNFFEPSARVPLLIRLPGSGEPAAASQSRRACSTSCRRWWSWPAARWRTCPLRSTGVASLPLAGGQSEPGRRVVAEYAAEGSIAPMVMLRAGPFKYIHADPDPPLLFDLGSDPAERSNLAGTPDHAGLEQQFRAVIADSWDLAGFRADVLASQARRRIVYEALRNGSYYPWDFQPLQKASERYMRNHMDLNVVEATSRFPAADE